MPDPWGVRRAENLLTSLEGVLSARVVTTPLGEVSEIHILAGAGLAPKQIVRNVESALLAHLGLKVDHRKISIAQTADVRPIEALERGVVREQALRRAILFQELAVSPASRPHHVVMAVTLVVGERVEVGEAEVADTPQARVEGSARAAAVVVERLVEKHSVVVEDARVVEGAGRRVVLVTVRGIGGRESWVLHGTAEAGEHPERAAVFAVLDATNRWAEARRSG
jgi:hypothetical protein